MRLTFVYLDLYGTAEVRRTADAWLSAVGDFPMDVEVAGGEQQPLAVMDAYEAAVRALAEAMRDDLQDGG